MIRIITDSASDITIEEAKELGVEVVPLHVIFGNDVFMDGVDISHDEFYKRLEECDELPKTSQTNPGGFVEVFEKYIKQGDLFVCSSINEGFSLVIAEAMILGLPAISTNCSGPNELLNFGEYGYIVENNDKALYKGLKEIINDDKKLQYYKKKSSERVDFFNYKNRISDIERLFN